jgi:DNA-binding NarL/FixJ family response regulator
MRVLIVDDSEALVQRLTSSLMEVTGIEIVGHAGNVSDAALEIRKAKPDVVILDIRMPGGSGIDVLEGLKNDPFQPVVIMLTNYSGRQYRRRCLESGARYFFDKSAEFHKVAEVLRGLMDTSSA